MAVWASGFEFKLPDYAIIKGFLVRLVQGKLYFAKLWAANYGAGRLSARQRSRGQDGHSQISWNARHRICMPRLMPVDNFPAMVVHFRYVGLRHACALPSVLLGAHRHSRHSGSGLPQGMACMGDSSIFPDMVDPVDRFANVYLGRLRRGGFFCTDHC